LNHTPAEVSKLKREAGKAGRQTATLLADNPGYKTTEEKCADDPELKEFMDILSS